MRSAARAARVRSAGRLHLAGRAKDLIIRSGHNIDPQTIEAALSAYLFETVVGIAKRA